MTTSPITLEPEQTMTFPLIVRLPLAEADRRTVPVTLRVASPSEELLLPTTFKTGASLGGEDD